MKKILVVDDDANIARVLRIRLRFAGYDVLTALDGATGLRLAMEGKFDLVLLDILMPVGGGFSVVHRLREQALAVPVIFMTASKQPGLRAMADTLGAAGFLEKPYKNEELLAAVTKALRTKSAALVDGPDTSKAQVTASDPATGAGQPRASNSVATKQHTILIVEDDRRIAMALTTRLQYAGHEVIQAFDALSGLEAATKRQPDLILMDIALPGGSGLTAAQRIQSAVPRLTPIIFLTASRQAGLRQKALALGAAGFLEKPYDPEKLLARIQDTLLAAEGPISGSSPPPA